MIDNKKQFRVLLSLTKKQPWLAQKVDELENLLFNECINQEEQSLILELLERFTHISHEKFSEYLHTFAEEIVTDPKLEDKSTLLVSMTADSNPDSGQYVIYALKPIFEKMMWRKHVSVTNFQKTWSKFKSSNYQHTNIVLIDEFTGSGKTILGRVKTLKALFSDKGYEINIIVKTLFTSEVGKQVVESTGISFSSLLVIDKGISSFYEGDELKKKVELMNRLEDILSKSYEERSLPSFGYGGTESLYTRDDGNTPNSVFPIFWWPFLRGSSTRKTLLTRAMTDA